MKDFFIKNRVDLIKNDRADRAPFNYHPHSLLICDQYFKKIAFKSLQDKFFKPYSVL